jgi:MFS family permease
VPSVVNQNKAASAAGSRWRQAIRSLRHHDYRIFLAGQLVSLIGTWIDTVAESWLIYRLTGSAALLGLAGFVSQFPVFLLSPLGGAIADRLDRRNVLIATQALSMVLAFALALLTLSGHIQVWQVMLLAALLGIVNAVDIPTRQAFVVDLVGRTDIVNAVALNSTMFNSARVLGPAVAGLLVAAVGEGWCFFINAVSFLAVIGSLVAIRHRSHQREAFPGTELERLMAGFQYASRNRPVRTLLLLVGLNSLMGMPYSVLMPIFSENILHAGAAGLGILMGAAGLGALVGAISLALREGLRGLGRWIAVGNTVFGVCLILFAMSRSFWLSAALLLPAGGAMIVVLASSNTLLQSMVPDKLRGRVMALYSMVFMGMAPVGALAAGWIAEHWGAPLAVALGGGACILGAAVFAWHLPTLRQEARQLILSLEPAAGLPAQQNVANAVVTEDRRDKNT